MHKMIDEILVIDYEHKKQTVKKAKVAEGEFTHFHPAVEQMLIDGEVNTDIHIANFNLVIHELEKIQKLCKEQLNHIYSIKNLYEI